ncbi:MAG: peroxiredoxin, partial [Thermoflexales bacterium]|nr:peroxiredoxin [Thermoflexales bacterium]
PDFELESEFGVVRSADLRGTRYVLYFYPADDTPGCTKEACSFRDALQAFNELGVRVFGVSPQGLDSKRKFAAKYGLNFPLLADVDHKVAEAFGVWGERTLYGKKFMGVTRSTFVIGPDGRIEHVWEKVKPEGHAEEVLAVLRGEAPQQAKPKHKRA